MSYHEVLSPISDLHLLSRQPHHLVKMAEHLDSQQEKRVAIRFNTTNVPGEPRQRCRQIATDFAQLMLNRGLSHDDHVHLPADFYSNTSQMLYTLCDFNIRDKVPHVENITTEFWKVTYDGQQSP